MHFGVYDINRFDNNLYDNLIDALQRVCKIGASNLPFNVYLSIFEQNAIRATITRIDGQIIRSPLEFFYGSYQLGLIDNTNDLQYLLNNSNSVFSRLVTTGNGHLQKIHTIQTGIDYMCTQIQYGSQEQEVDYRFVKICNEKSNHYVNWQQEGF